MVDYSIVEAKKIIVRLIEIGVRITDEQIEEVAKGLFEATNNDFEENKKDFVKDIHRIIGK